MKKISSLLLVLFLANIALMAEGQQEKKQEPKERTPIKSNEISKATLTGVLEKENDMIFLVLKSGEKYALNPNKKGGPGREDGPRGDGPPPGGQGGGPESNTNGSDQPPPPKEESDQFAEYMGLEVVIQGMILETPPHDENLKDVAGVVFPESIVINGEEMLK